MDIPDFETAKKNALAARGKLHIAAVTSCFSGSEAQEALDGYAHALAQMQRAWMINEGYGPLEPGDDGICPCGSCSWCLAQDYIDLIDPKAQT